MLESGVDLEWGKTNQGQRDVAAVDAAGASRLVLPAERLG